MTIEVPFKTLNEGWYCKICITVLTIAHTKESLCQSERICEGSITEILDVSTLYAATPKQSTLARAHAIAGLYHSSSCSRKSCSSVSPPFHLSVGWCRLCREQCRSIASWQHGFCVIQYEVHPILSVDLLKQLEELKREALVHVHGFVSVSLLNET